MVCCHYHSFNNFILKKYIKHILFFQSKLFVLFEHAAGYGVFKVEEFEEIGLLLPQLEASVYDLGRFNSIVKLIGFSPFKSAVVALENINAISEGILPEELQHYLDITIPKGGKKDKVTLGVSDPKLAAAITEALNITCTHVGVVPEIIRGKHNFSTIYFYFNLIFQ